MMASLSRTRLVEILWTLLLLAQNLGVCSGASGGYYARLLNIPLVCPYISFCMPWVPKTGLSATSHR